MSPWHKQPPSLAAVVSSAAETLSADGRRPRDAKQQVATEHAPCREQAALTKPNGISRSSSSLPVSSLSLVLLLVCNRVWMCQKSSDVVCFCAGSDLFFFFLFLLLCDRYPLLPQNALFNRQKHKERERAPRCCSWLLFPQEVRFVGLPVESHCKKPSTGTSRQPLKPAGFCETFAWCQSPGVERARLLKFLLLPPRSSNRAGATTECAHRRGKT